LDFYKLFERRTAAMAVDPPVKMLKLRNCFAALVA
jgi:hypothetical protein